MPSVVAAFTDRYQTRVRILPRQLERIQPHHIVILPMVNLELSPVRRPAKLTGIVIPC